MGNIIWLTGNSGAGKTTLANAAQKEFPNIVVLDGDEMRESISLGAGFSKEEREEHNLRVARLAKVLSDRGNMVIVSVIAPFEDTRKKITTICNPFWVYVQRDMHDRENYPYEPPKEVDMTIHTDSTYSAVEYFVQFLLKDDMLPYHCMTPCLY